LTSGSIPADDQEIIRMPAQMLGLEVDCHHRAVDQDRRYALNKQLTEPIRIDVLLEDRARSSSGGGTRDAACI